MHRLFHKDAHLPCDAGSRKPSGIRHIRVGYLHAYLIVHIPEKHFKMLRYYGIYAKHHKQEKKLRKCISAEKQRFLRSIQDWRQSILLSFGYDPLCCSECGTSMLVLEVYHKKTTLFEQYRKVMKYG